MSVQQAVRRSGQVDATVDSGTQLSPAAGKALALLRVSTGFIFLWAFADKLFGLHYATPSARAWIHGGSPTKGFLKGVEMGPFQSFYHSIAGSAWTNWLFMLGLLGIGVAVMSGLAMRIAAVSGVLMMAMMWFAEFPLAQHMSNGQPSGSNNPLVDYHWLYAVALIALAATHAGHYWGLGRVWEQLPLVRKNRWAR